MALQGFTSWTPTDASREILQQVHAVLKEYEDHLPMTGRQIFYRMVGAFGYEKSEAAANRLYGVIGRARRAGMLPFGVIRDGGSSKLIPLTWDDADGFWTDVRERWEHFNRDRQAGQPSYVELFCEAPGMMQQLQRIAFPYSVPVYGTRGFTGLGVTAEIVCRALTRPGPTVLLQVGDHDPSGEAIFSSMAADARTFVLQVVGNLARHDDEGDSVGGSLADGLGLGDDEIAALLALDRRDRPSLSAKRVALTAVQVEEFGLPTAPVSKTKAGGRNPHSAGWVGETCQLEAMPPDLLADVVRSAIEDEFDMDRYALELEDEERDREAIGTVIEEVLG